MSQEIDIFDFTLTADESANIDAMDTVLRGGPDPDLVGTEKSPIKIEDLAEKPMVTWSKDELRRIAESDDLHISPFREDG